MIKYSCSSYRAIAIIALLLCSAVCHAQEAAPAGATQKPEKQRNNVVRFNLSNFMLFGPRNIIIGYERVVSPTQSFSVNFGRADLPTLVSIDTDSMRVTRQSSKTGFNFSLDYRFYLKHENKYGAPHGLYIGPYVMYNKIHKESEWEIVHPNGTDDVTVDTDFVIFGAGIELGYQFVLFKRITLDMVLIGPGLARYDLRAKIDGSIDLSEREQLLDFLQQAIENRYPGMNIALEDKEINADGKLNVTSVGFRYLIQVGYRF